jgi:hypothetical protein
MLQERVAVRLGQVRDGHVVEGLRRARVVAYLRGLGVGSLERREHGLDDFALLAAQLSVGPCDGHEGLDHRLLVVLHRLASSVTRR